jgi:hypothetical protein
MKNHSVKSMYKQLFFFFMLIGSGCSGQVGVGTASVGQVGIGTASIHASAKLQIEATDKGFLPPRVSLTSTTDVSTILTPATGLLVYNTATAGSSPSNVVPGFYYYNGSSWIKLVIASDKVSNVTGIISIANGGTGNTNGSITGTGALSLNAGGTNQNVTLSPSGTGKTILNGNVGIGNITATTTLEVGSANGTIPGEILLNPTSGSNEGGQLVIKKSVAGSTKDWNIDQFVDNSNPRLRVFPDVESNGLTITEGGNVSLGYDGRSLSNKLTVIGSAKITDNLDAKGSYYMVAGLRSNQLLTSSADNTIQLADKDDPNNWWDAANYKFQPDVAGYYFVSTLVHFSLSGATNTSVQCNLQILKNNTTVGVNQVLINQPTVSINLSRSQTLTAIVYLNGSSDFIKITGYTDNAASEVNLTGDTNQVWTKMEAYKLN